MAARNAVLKYLRVSIKPVLPFQNPRATGGGLSQLIRRHFCEEARGSFLDKSEVTDRVINVVKNFQKVDPSKLLIIDRTGFNTSARNITLGLVSTPTSRSASHDLANTPT